jgi:hypothetical protein
MDGYPHGRGIKLHLANGVELAVRFIIVSDSPKSNSPEVFPEIMSFPLVSQSHIMNDTFSIDELLEALDRCCKSSPGPDCIHNEYFATSRLQARSFYCP